MVDNAQKAAPDSVEQKQKDKGEVEYWLGEIASAHEREKNFRKEGTGLVKVFEGGKVDETPYNILYSNTETILPAVYSATPRPLVRPRFNEGDQTLQAAAAKVCQSVLEFFVDTGDSRYSSFDELMTSAVVESLVPGRGTTRFKYDAELSNTEKGEVSEDGPDTDEEPKQQVTYETVCGEEVPWDRVLFGFAKKWKETPWMAIAWPMTRDELVDNFGFELGVVIKLQEAATSSGDDKDDKSTDSDDKSDTKIAWVYEIWDKISKKVIFVSPGYEDAVLRKKDDPYKLSGFFPCPKPLTFITKIKSMVPVAPYKLYQNQAEELNSITTRITKITRALRVRGFYDATLEDIEDVLDADDNELIPAKNVSALQQGQSLESSIWLVPISELVGVLQQLYQNREAVKNVIFEVMGIADIMRGSSVASETLGAQQMKAQWGSMRLRNMQKSVMKYSVESLRIKAEIAFGKLSQKTIQQMTGLPYPTNADKAQAQQGLQHIQMQMVQIQQQAVPGQQPPALPPQMQQQMAAAQALLATPSWEDILGVLQNDLQRYYKIDIETNSTVDAAATEDKQDMAELMNAMGQFLSGIGPLVEQGIMPFEAAQAMLISIVRKYRFGYDVEEQLKKMKPPAPQQGGDGGAAAKQQSAEAQAQSDQQIAQIKVQTTQVQQQAEQQKAIADAKQHEQNIQLSMAQAQRKEQLDQIMHQTQLENAARQTTLAIAKHEAMLEQIALKRAAAKAQAQ